MPRKNKGKNKVTIYPDWCKGCGICVAFCPSKVLVMSPEGKAVVEREADCIRCGFCELHCPDFAIVVCDKEFDKATELVKFEDVETEKKKATGKGA
ncbi:MULTISPECIES: 4Fe-4S dicluster domain-containing protein [unclassified Pseudodesulfovibrio]|uniref:4Fe-4S dicluster domain-containing protein n=1 Tax=unclassified Pseudodesulfovibrio TaxID=2661612 RepID=UPI0019D4B67E|nr:MULTISPECIES: 4Fe-4S dicluster domain-containing protein [unclassified Pseudodesulfovibrio]MCJ2163249.1 4Fe-4S dicluster domain-containing protein [Pseudodesulfovibrio sp. S3-i]